MSSPSELTSPARPVPRHLQGSHLLSVGPIFPKAVKVSWCLSVSILLVTRIEEDPASASDLIHRAWRSTS